MKKSKLLFLGLLLLAILSGIYFLTRSSGSEDTIVIVNGEDVNLYGDISFELVNFEMQPVIIKEDRLVLYRSGDTIDDLVIQPGDALRWDKDLKLYKVGTFDLGKSNEELAKSYGIKIK